MAETAILKPYERRREPGLVTRIVVFAGLIFLAAFYGLMSTILPLQLIAIPAVPILILVGVCLWLLPDIGGVQDDFLAKGLLRFAALSILWPSFVAFNAPGLPWITPTRIVVFSALAVFLVNYSTSAEMRERIAASMRNLPLLAKFFWLFWAVTAFSLVFSEQPITSANKFINNQIFWTMMFALSAWLSMRAGFAARLAQIMAWTIIVIALVALYEYRVKSVFWVPWLPAFLKADPEVISKLLQFNGRAGTDIYRVRGTYGGALYFAEYLAISFPFVVHAFATAKRAWHAALLGLAILLMMSVMIFTDSRSAALAMLLSPLVYGFMAAWRFRAQNPSSITATGVVLAYPAVAVVLGLLVVFWRRLHVMVIGGGQHQGSSDARAVQWEMGWPKIATHPFGHGVGRSGEELGFMNPGADNYTVDSYYLTLLLDYGVLGLLVYLLIFGVAIWYGFRGYTRARTPDALALAPITIALLNFIIIKSVSSSEINFPIIVILLGCVIGVVGQQKRSDKAAADGVTAAPAGA